MIENDIKISVNDFAKYFKSGIYSILIVLLWNYTQKVSVD